MKKIILVFVLFVSVGVCFAQTITVDPTFNPGGLGPDGRVYSSIVQPDGKIILVGSFTKYNGVNKKCIVRLLSDGTIDESFDPGVGVVNQGAIADLRSVVFLDNGKYLVGGSFISYAGSSNRYVMRLNSDGSPDFTFSIYNLFSNFIPSFVNVITKDNDGNFYIGGDFTTPGYGQDLIKINSNGGIVDDFNSEVPNDGYVNNVRILPNGKILVGGFFSSQFVVGTALLNADGTLDSSFDTASSSYGSVYSTYVQENQKIMISGVFSTLGDDQIVGMVVARLNTDGSIDSSFQVYEPSQDVAIAGSNVVLLNDKYLVVGSFPSYGGGSANGIMVLNTNGTVDQSFDFGTGFEKYIRIVHVLPDNKILIGGDNLQNYNGQPVPSFTRLQGAPLSTNYFLSDSNVVAYKQGGEHFYKSGLKLISEVRVFDILGRELYSFSNINNKEFSFPAVNIPQIFLSRIILEDQTVVAIKSFN